MSIPANALVGLRTNGDRIEIVNQLLLPHLKEYISINSTDDAYEAIKSMKVFLCYPCGLCLAFVLS